MKKILLILFTLALIPGCAYFGVAKERAKLAYDKALNEAEWVICDAASVGSIKRKYGASQEAMDAWEKLCGQKSFKPFTSKEPK